MTPRLTASLHALTQAARKGMPMPELEMHLEQITNEVENLQTRAGARDAIKGLVDAAESVGALKSLQNLAGVRDLPKIELRANPK